MEDPGGVGEAALREIRKASRGLRLMRSQRMFTKLGGIVVWDLLDFARNFKL